MADEASAHWLSRKTVICGGLIFDEVLRETAAALGSDLGRESLRTIHMVWTRRRASVWGAVIVVMLCAPAITWAQGAPDFRLSLGGNFADHSTDSANTVPRTTSLPIALRVDVNPYLTVHASASSLLHVSPVDSPSTTGFGDTKLGITPATPTIDGFQLAADYTVKLPTGSHSKNLGSGFTDHQVVVSPNLALDANQANAVSADIGFAWVGTDAGHDRYFVVSGYYTRKTGAKSVQEVDAEVDYTQAAHSNPSDAILNVGPRIVFGSRTNSAGTRSTEWMLAPGFTAGLVTSSSRWGGYVSLTYVNEKANAQRALFLRPFRPPSGRHILGLGVTGSRR